MPMTENLSTPAAWALAAEPPMLPPPSFFTPSEDMQIVQSAAGRPSEVRVVIEKSRPVTGSVDPWNWLMPWIVATTASTSAWSSMVVSGTSALTWPAPDHWLTPTAIDPSLGKATGSCRAAE